MFGKGKFGGGMIFKTEVVNGICPTCTSDSVFVSICASIYRCTNCGSDLEQKVNGVIQYIPTTSSGGKIPILKAVENGPQEN
jgi:transposase-like protein